MTLCIAWKQGTDVYVASDSRLTKPDSTILTDEAPKIFKVHCEIYSSTPVEFSNQPEEIEYQTTYGLCFAGSYLNGSALADTVDEVLSGIQTTPYSDVSIDNLSDIAFGIYKQVSTQLYTINGGGGLSEVLFGGHCFVNRQFKLFKFFPKPVNSFGDPEFLKEELIFNGQAFLLGDKQAKIKAEELLKKLDAKYTPFHVLRDVIRDDSVPTVGGTIQCGVFRPSKFKTYGIVEYSSFKDEFGILQVKDNYKFRGLSIDFGDNALTKGNLNIHKPYFNPFADEREALFKESFESIDAQAKKLSETPPDTSANK